MKSMFEFIFLFSVFLIVYNYFIYPVAINIATRFHRDPHLDKIDANFDLPTVTMIIAAFNEDKVIEAKIKNSLKLDYPKDKFQLIVVSDGSDDDTSSIAEKYSDDGVLSMHQPERRGKSAALNRGLEQATGDVIVFSDANNDFSENAIKALVQHFSDDEIGAVTGAKHIYSSDDRESAKGDGLYWKYEAMIKKAESSLGSITAAEGEILAVRKSLMKPIDPNNINDDAAITFDIVKSGYRMLYEEEARSEEEASKDLLDDVNVKIRMTAGGFQTIKNEASYLIPPRNWFAFSFFSHKILRWLTPHLMILAFACNWLLLAEVKYQFLLFLQFAFYAIALTGWFSRDKSLPTFIYVPMYFCVMNLALFRGYLSYRKGAQGVNWKKAER